jgi:pSer/pThr/pTyr-binding forkhead associated (FHA) protein
LWISSRLSVDNSNVQYNVKRRTHASDIKINDPSVSRHHAILKVIGDAVYLDDNDSKFGTLVKVKEPLELVVDRPCYIQVGDTVMALLVKGPRTESRSSEPYCRIGKELTKNIFT